MIYEVADLEVAPDAAQEFEAAVALAVPHFRNANGCHSFRLERSVDRPGRYRLVVKWDSVDAHMVDFRGSPGFAAWRALTSRFFVSPPMVDHVEAAIEGF